MALKAAFMLMLIFIVGEKRCIDASPLNLGKCPVKESMANFSLEKFSGLWYAVELNKPNVSSAKCTQIVASVGENGSFNMISAYYMPLSGHVGEDRHLSLPRTDTSGKFQFKVEDPGETGGPDVLNMLILDSDYTNYAVMYFCAEMNIYHDESVMIWSRTAELAEEFRSTAQEVVRKYRFPSLDGTGSIPQNCGEYRCSSRNMSSCSYSSLPRPMTLRSYYSYETS